MIKLNKFPTLRNFNVKFSILIDNIFYEFRLIPISNTNWKNFNIEYPTLTDDIISQIRTRTTFKITRKRITFTRNARNTESIRNHAESIFETKASKIRLNALCNSAMSASRTMHSMIGAYLLLHTIKNAGVCNLKCVIRISLDTFRIKNTVAISRTLWRSMK